MNYLDWMKEQAEVSELALLVAPLTPADRPQVAADPWTREAREGASVERGASVPVAKPDLDDYSGFAR